MRKLLAYSLCIGMAFVGAYPSHAEYPDGKVLLERLGIKIDEDGKPVADGTGGCLPDAFACLLAGSTTEKLTQLCGDEMALEEDRWHNYCAPDTCDRCFAEKMGIIPNEADLYRIGDLVKSREFLTGVFGEDFVSEFLGKAWNGTERVHTELVSKPQFPEYYSLREKYEKKKRENNKQIEAFDEDKMSDYWRCYDDHFPFEGPFQSETKAFEELSKRHVSECLRDKLKKNWNIFRDVSIKSDLNKIRLAEVSILKELGCLPDYKGCMNPVRISFGRLRTFMGEYLKSIPDFLKEWQEKERDWEMKRAEVEVGKELLNEMKAYRERFKGEDVCEYEGESFPISTEPLMVVDIWIYQEHFKDANGARKLYTEDWEQRVVDLDINLRLTIDTRTRKLLSAFCEGQFIMNDQVVTDFGTGLCIFKSEQPQGFAEEKK